MIETEEVSEKKYEVTPIKKVLTCLARLVCVPFIWFFYRVVNNSRVIGSENIPEGGGVIFASNHVSGIDTFLVPYFTVRRFSMIPYFSPAKEELFKVPVLGSILPLLGSFPVKRRARDFEVMRKITAISRRYRVMLFPEGTRSKTGELGRGRAGVGWIVYQSRPKVIPTLVINTDKYFWPGKARPWFRIPYTIVFGEEVGFSEFYEKPDCKETSQAIADKILGAIAALKEKHKNLYMDR